MTTELELQFKETVEIYRPQLNKVREEIELNYKELHKKIKELREIYYEQQREIRVKAAALSEKCGLPFYSVDRTVPIDECDQELYTPNSAEKWRNLSKDIFFELKEWPPQLDNIGWSCSSIC